MFELNPDSAIAPDPVNAVSRFTAGDYVLLACLFASTWLLMWQIAKLVVLIATS